MWRALVEQGEALVTTNYILIETIALVQHRLGLEALRVLTDDILPTLQVHWIGQQDHAAALAALLVAARRRLSFVDCSSFETMRRLGISAVFGFDRHFAEQGFQLLPRPAAGS